MSDRAAMQMALDALNLPSLKTQQMLQQRDEAIATLRAALEQQAEPVALIRDGVLRWYIPREHYSRPAWTAHGTHMLYASPPQRQPLTWQQVVDIGLECANDMSSLPFEVKLARAIEQAHGIKEKP